MDWYFDYVKITYKYLFIRTSNSSQKVEQSYGLRQGRTDWNKADLTRTLIMLLLKSWDLKYTSRATARWFKLTCRRTCIDQSQNACRDVIFHSQDLNSHSLWQSLHRVVRVYEHEQSNRPHYVCVQVEKSTEIASEIWLDLDRKKFCCRQVLKVSWFHLTNISDLKFLELVLLEAQDPFWILNLWTACSWWLKSSFDIKIDQKSLLNFFRCPGFAAHCNSVKSPSTALQGMWGQSWVKVYFPFNNN